MRWTGWSTRRPARFLRATRPITCFARRFGLLAAGAAGEGPPPDQGQVSRRLPVLVREVQTWLLMLVFAVVEGFRMPMVTSPEEILENRGEDIPRWHFLLRLWPVYLLLAFLALQPLLWVAKSGKNERRGEQDL